jgi:hypothetical protein
MAGKGGRQKGIPNKKTRSLEETAARVGVDIFEVLCMFAHRDWKGLGYQSATETRVLKDGGTIEVEKISPELRLNAAKEAAKYLFPQRKAVEMSNPEGEGFRVIVEDFVSDKK